MFLFIYFFSVRVESPTKVYLGKHKIKTKVPTEHPFSTHIEQADLFPAYEIPLENANANSITHLPAAAPHFNVSKKSRGAPYRHEISATPEEWERKPIDWIEEPNFYQVN